jgi:uncharacterized ferritin-like protein (DUF455 family)
MTPEKLAHQILFGDKLEDKLISLNIEEFPSYKGNPIPASPARAKSIIFSQEKIKFPKHHLFHLPEKRAMALHYFANHELLAIEMMAAFLWKFPTLDEDDKKIKRGIISTLEDEQRHLKLYIQRMKDFGVEFGSYPLNDFFWKQMVKIQKPEQFFAVMSLTLESANLDFALFYKNIFSDVEDHKSAALMNVIFEDEMTHVKFGYYWLNKWKMDRDLFDYYQMVLPENITPSRARGIGYQRATREKLGFEQTFLEKFEKYQDPAPFLNRKKNV